MKARALVLLISLGLLSCNRASPTSGGEPTAQISQRLQPYTSGLYSVDIEDPAFTVAMGSGSDWGVAFRKFLSDSPVQRVRLACNKTYTVQSTVDVCRQVIVEGCGPTTVISAAAGVTPFRIRAGAGCEAPAVGGGESRFHDFKLHEAAAATVVRFGFWAEAATHIEDVTIQGFSNGVRIDADASRSGAAQSDATGWSLNRVTVKSSEHAAVLAFGRDANAGVAELVSAEGSCTQAGKLGAGGSALYPVHGSTSPIFPECAGIVDASLGGNVWSALWTTGTVGSFPGARFEGFDANADGLIDAADDSGHAVCLGCRKDETIASVLSKNAIAVGNRSAYTGGGININAVRTMSNATLTTPGLWPVDRAGTDATDPVMFLTLRDGTLMHWELNGNYNLRGSWKGANAYTGWYWTGTPAAWAGIP